MFEIKGLNGESLVVDGGWVEKLRAGNSIGRKPASSYRSLEIKETSRKKFVVFGEKEELLQLILAFDTYFSLMVPAEKRGEVDQLRSELENARQVAGA